MKNKPIVGRSEILSPAKKPTVKNEASVVPVVREDSNSTQQKSSFLGKFRKDSPRLPLKESSKGILLIECLLLFMFGRTSSIPGLVTFRKVNCYRFSTVSVRFPFGTG